MSRDDIQKLLGGYATGTLTPEERQALFDAALTDQELFDALVREEALREVLSDPAARAQLLAAVDDVPAPWYRHWWRPAVVIATALLLVAGIAVWQNARTPRPLRMAKLEPMPRTVVQSAPILPPPPKLKQTPPNLTPFLLPLAAPAAPPPPPPQETKGELAKVEAVTVSAAASDLPMQQAQQVQSEARLQALPSRAHLAPANTLLPRTDVPVRGVVTDASGAGVRSATVVVKSLSTGEAMSASTDDRGEFHTSGVPGGVYQISASAPGFRNATVVRAVPAYGTPEPVNVTLDVGATAETVEVTASAAPVIEARPAAVSSGAMAAMMKKAPAAAPRLPQYTLLRRTASGVLEPVAAEGTVSAGDILTLRIVPSADGYLRIVQSTGRAIANPRVKRGVAFETALPKFDAPGRVELQIYYSPQRTESKDLSFPVTIAFHIE